MYGELAGILTSISFALSFVLARRIQEEATPIFQNTIRALVGFITFFIICLMFGVILTFSQLPILIIFMLMLSILFTVILGDTAYLQSQKVLGPAKALAIGNTTPFFTILFSTFFLGRPFTILMIFSGILIGIGAYIINIKDSSRNDENENLTKSSTKTKSGLLWAFFASISWAIGLSLSDYSIGQTNQILGLGILSTIVAMMVRFLFASVVLIGVSLIEQRKKPIPKSRSTWKFLILSAILSYSLGSIFFGEAVYIVGASFMALISTAMPLFTIPFSYLINKEKLSKKGFLGVILTVLGVILILI
ncbi:MAG: DMT family transporter [Candidatus Thorarchaeota archaeon]